MIQIGLFPLQSNAPLRVSFFNCALPSVRKLAWAAPGHPNTTAYSQTWRSVVASLPSSAIQTYFTSLISALPVPGDSMGCDLVARQLVKEHARILSIFVASRASNQQDDDAEVVRVALSSLLLSRNWNEHVARVAVCWIFGHFLSNSTPDEAGASNHLWMNAPGVALKFVIALITFSESVLDVWSSPQHNQNPLVSRHRCMPLLTEVWDVHGADLQY